MKMYRPWEDNIPIADNKIDSSVHFKIDMEVDEVNKELLSYKTISKY